MGNDTKQTKEKGTKRGRLYSMPLPMEEAGSALMEYVNKKYGNNGKGVQVSIVQGQVLLSIDPTVKS